MDCFDCQAIIGLLSPTDREKSVILSQTLFGMADRAQEMTVEELADWGKSNLSKEPDFKLEYLEIVHPDTFEAIPQNQQGGELVFLLAGWLGGIRLIDNVKI